jgi:hypothetical protein
VSETAVRFARGNQWQDWQDDRDPRLFRQRRREPGPVAPARPNPSTGRPPMPPAARPPAPPAAEAEDLQPLKGFDYSFGAVG